MTIQGAIYELNNMLSSNDIPCYWKPAIKKIIETVEQNVREMSEQTDGDLISRQAVIDVILSVDNGENHIDELTTNVIGYMEQLPSAEKTAEWIIHPVYAHLVCSECLSNAPYDCKTNYCPNCGRRMKGEQPND